MKAFESLTNVKPSKPPDLELINFYGFAGTIKSLSFNDLLSEDLGSLNEKLQGRIIFFGFQTIPWQSSPRKGDFRTSISNVPMSDTEVRATIAANLIDGSAIHRAAKVISNISVYIIFIAIFSFGLFTSRLTAALPIGFLVVCAICVEYIVLIDYHHWISGLGTILIGSLLALVINASKKTAAWGERR